MKPVAPPIEGSSWLVGDPIAWDDLRGRITMVVFWSAACESSLLRIRQAQRVVETSPHGVIAIGVHTPRFPFEEDVETVRSIVTQHRLRIPIVHDPDYITWNRYQPQGWPSTAIVDADGRVLGMDTGADNTDHLARYVNELATKNRKQPITEVRGIHPPLPLPNLPVTFPTAVAVRHNDEIVVAEGGRGRVIAFNLNKELTQAWAVGQIQGFGQPSSLAFDHSGALFVADTSHRTVSRIGPMGKTHDIIVDDFTAPHGLEIDSDNSVVVTDPVDQQIYRLVDQGDGKWSVGVVAGSGRTGTENGSAGGASLAQPTGLTRTEIGLVFCDAASSNIRLLTNRGRVATITGNDLYDWGLLDGPAHEAKLQRPSDVAVAADGSIIIVDTGNNRLRRLSARRIRTLGLRGLQRPASTASLGDGKLIVANTGCHDLVVVDPLRNTSWPIEMIGVPEPSESPTPHGAGAPTSRWATRLSSAGPPME